ncbi:MAG: NUDIX domain-containing protein [Desulfobacterales bacterium]|nr:NUDIX domain-containing protein [Desulfobacterales bacterium]MDX2495540.1 NUDIX domain-containing protein [Desulfuromusa sp.]
MKFNPGNFYFGVVDFFSIMLPGGLLAFSLYGSYGDKLFGQILPEIPKISDSIMWVVFLFAAYLFGHIVFLIGSYLDYTYDIIRPCVWSKKKDHAYKQTGKLKKQFLGEEKIATMNNFQWAKAVLKLHHPEGMVEVARLEADSKFFRSLFVVVSFLFVAGFLGDHNRLILFLMAIVIIVSYCRYAELRHKSTEQAYRHLIVIHSHGKLERVVPRCNDTPTHAGGIVYRHVNDKVEYLLVSARNQPELWVLPKGHIEPGEDIEHAALREVFEETGVTAKIVAKIPRPIRFECKGEQVHAVFYLMEYLNEKQAMENRQSAWVSLEEALQRIPFKDTVKILQEADKMRRG